MSLTFYHAPMSTASTTHWCLEELGIPYDRVAVDIKSETDKQKKLGPVNPNLKVPVLVHDGTAIFESAAIQIYLGETFGVEKGLYPAPGPRRGEAMKWLVWTNVTLGEAVGRWLRNTSEDVPRELRNVAAGEAARKEIDVLIGHLEAHFVDKPYMLGDAISLVDIHLASLFQWLTYCGVELAPFPKVAAWFARCTARPSSGRVL